MKSWSVIIQLKSTEQYFPVVLFTVNGGSDFWVCGWILKCDHSIESYWAVLSCGTVYYAVLAVGGSTFWVHGSNPREWPFKWIYWAVLSCDAVYCAVQGGSNFWFCGWNPKVWPFKWNLLSSWYFPVVLFIMLHMVVQSFDSVEETVKCDHSNDKY